jgi:hypothetical protein
VPGRTPLFREAALALFLIAVALGLWLADVRPLAVAGVMALALAVAWVIEWVSWREDHLEGLRPVAEPPPAEGRAEPAPAQPAPAQPLPAAPLPVGGPAPAKPASALRARGLWLLRAARGVRSETAKADQAAPKREAGAPSEKPRKERVAEEAAPPAPPEPVAPEPVAPEPVAPEPQPPVDEPRPSRRRLQPVQSAAPPPPPEPEPEPSLAPAEPEPQGAPVVPLWARSSQPREWNLWELERIARGQSRLDPERFEEWSYLFLHLRRFANADGMLPAEFDGLVRDYFGGLFEPVQGA